MRIESLRDIRLARVFGVKGYAQEIAIHKDEPEERNHRSILDRPRAICIVHRRHARAQTRDNSGNIARIDEVECAELFSQQCRTQKRMDDFFGNAWTGENRMDAVEFEWRIDFVVFA